MCGIAGLFRPGGGDESTLAGHASRMADTLRHRGPDAGNIWTNAPAGVAFGHRRLSILDLSEAGAQPMRSDCGRFAVTFNGEIYNHLDIRSELEAIGAGPNWRGHSDTETLLYSVRHWGVSGALQRFNGMFAFALWDEKERKLTLCRDRFGEKPLFYGWCGRDLVFASELKALTVHPEWAPPLDRAALTGFMRYSYVPAPSTIWLGIKKLPSASFVVFAADAVSGSMPDPAAYWSLRNHVASAQCSRIDDETEAAEELERLLSIAIKRQCLSDVPLGAFLSGGIDSSTIVALMQVQATQPVRTFTIGFSENAFDEAADARKVAEYLGTSHTELYVNPRTAIEVIPKLPRMYDEPFGDSSQIPTHLVAALARQHVTVALSGDGGDEWNAFNYDGFKANWIKHIAEGAFGSTDYLRDKPIIDCATGSRSSGMHTKWTSEYGAYHVIALELSHSVDGVMQENLRGIGNVDIVQCSIDMPPIKPHSINGLVICNAAIQHTSSVKNYRRSPFENGSSGRRVIF